MLSCPSPAETLGPPNKYTEALQPGPMPDNIEIYMQQNNYYRSNAIYTGQLKSLSQQGEQVGTTQKYCYQLTKSASEVNGDIESTGVGRDETSEESGPSVLARAFESESTTTAESGSYGPCAGRRESLRSPELHSPSSSPFRGVEPSGNTPAWVDDDPFEGVVVESISVGSVLVHTPHLTDPIAPFAGFSMQAEVVKSTSRYSEFRRSQRKTCLDKGSRAGESGGGLFFASRGRSRTSQLGVSNNEHSSHDRPPEQVEKAPVDYLKVDIPDISIELPGAESSP